MGRQSPDGSPWDIDGELYAENPAHFLPATYLDMIRLWRMCCGAWGYTGVWPDPGGIYDQAAVMIEAFALMTSRESAIWEAKKPRR